MRGIVLLCIALGLLSAQPVQGLDPATISAAASAIIAGSSIAGTSINGLMGDGYRVTCAIVVENWTKYPLTLPNVRLTGGFLSKPPRAILPSKREAMVARKTAHTATGSYGTVSWLIQGLNRRVFVMWSAPFNFDHHHNWMGVGLSRSGYVSHPYGSEVFDQMYYGNSDSNIGFTRDEYYYHSDPAIYSDSDIEVVGTMGTTHKAEVHIIVRPKREQDLADAIRALLQHKK
ncbi:hypothetical protein BaRGS_00013455 [Batillaria attramentaria]|uniref:Uncharacterized protein n=1 Tax=Batillaria attramentaria TaxID=370345 RepID=A0ABD0L7M2_9CAEN|nr:hypothetical protein BaRGS_004544 [Batillaria attramentaria]